MGQIASAAQATQKELGHFLEEEVRGLILAHVEDAASAAGREQAKLFGQEVAAEACKALEEASARARGAAQLLRQATSEMRKHSLLRAGVITAASSLGIIAAVMIALAFYLPSKSEMEALRTERAQLQASIEDLSNRGGRLTHSLCGDPKRFCVLIPAHPATWNAVDNKETVYVIPVGY